MVKRTNFVILKKVGIPPRKVPKTKKRKQAKSPHGTNGFFLVRLITLKSVVCFVIFTAKDMALHPVNLPTYTLEATADKTVKKTTKTHENLSKQLASDDSHS